MFLFVIFMVCLFYWFYVKDRRIEKLAEQFPGPPAHPIFGNLFNYFTTDLQEFRRRSFEVYPTYGDTIRLKLLFGYVISTIDPKVQQKMLSNTSHNLKKSEFYNVIKPLIGNGLTIASGSHWQKHRDCIQPAFTVLILKQFVEIFDQKSQILIDVLKDVCNETKIDIEKYVATFSSDIFMETSMGFKTDAKTDLNKKTEFADTVLILKKIMVNRTLSFWKRSDNLFSIFGYSEKRRFDKMFAVAKRIAIELIENRREYLLLQTASNKCATTNEDTDEKERLCFVDILLQSSIDGKSLSNDEIVDEAITFMIGGQDTTTHLASATLSLLSRHKHVQDRLFAEVAQVIGKNPKKPITYQQLNELNYMDMVVKEAVRLHPSIPFIGRHLDHDIVLDDGRIIPAGINLHINLDVTMRNPKYFKNPSNFDPERFAAGSALNDTQSYSYIPFSKGKRDCIGKRFAALSIKTMICRVLQQYELIEMGDEPIIVFEVTAQSVNGFQLALKPRVSTN